MPNAPRIRKQELKFKFNQEKVTYLNE